MPLYEHVYLARQDVSAQQVEDLTKQFTTVIEGLGGKVTKNEYWGVKSLNFRINKNRKAHFTLLNIDAPPAAVVAVVAVAAAFAAALVAITVAVDLAHHRRGTFLVLFDADGEITDDVFADPLLPLDLGDR